MVTEKGEARMTPEKRYLLLWLAWIEGLILFLGWYLWGLGAASMIFLFMFWASLKLSFYKID